MIANQPDSNGDNEATSLYLRADTKDALYRCKKLLTIISPAGADITLHMVVANAAQEYERKLQREVKRVTA